MQAQRIDQELRELFKEWSKSQKEFCDTYGVNRGNFSGYVNGKHSQPKCREALLRWRQTINHQAILPTSRFLGQQDFHLANPIPQFALPVRVRLPRNPPLDAPRGVPNDDNDDKVFRSLSLEQNKFYSKESRRLKDGPCVIFSARGSGDYTPAGHVAKNPTNSPYLSGTHSPLVSLFYCARELVLNRHATIAHTNREINSSIPGDIVDNRTANLDEWGITSRNFFRFTDEVLFKRSLKAYWFSDFTTDHPLYRTWKDQLDWDKGVSYTNFLLTNKKSMQDLRDAMTLLFLDHNRNPARITRSRAQYLNSCFQGEGVYLLGGKEGKQLGVYHTSQYCGRVRKRLEDGNGNWSIIPEAEALRIRRPFCAICKKKQES